MTFPIVRQIDKGLSYLFIQAVKIEARVHRDSFFDDVLSNFE